MRICGDRGRVEITMENPVPFAHYFPIIRTNEKSTRSHHSLVSRVISPSVEIIFHKLSAFQLNRLCEEAGGGIDLQIEQKELHVTPTKMDATNKYWTAFKEAIDELLVLKIAKIVG